MNISYKWLKEYVDFDLTPQEVCDALTSEGLEVDALEEVQSIKGGLKGLYVGKVLTCEMHPNSDHLHVTTVDLGKGVLPQSELLAHRLPEMPADLVPVIEEIWAEEVVGK